MTITPGAVRRAEVVSEDATAGTYEEAVHEESLHWAWPPPRALEFSHAAANPSYGT